MTRTVAIGAVIGFAATVIALALWDRGGNSGVVIQPTVIDAGAIGGPVNPAAMRAFHGNGLVVPVDRRAMKVMITEPGSDAGQ